MNDPSGILGPNGSARSAWDCADASTFSCDCGGHAVAEDCATFYRCGRFFRCEGLRCFLPLPGTVRMVGENGADTPEPLLPNPPFLPNLHFLSYFLWCDLLLTWSHHPPSVSIIPSLPRRYLLLKLIFPGRNSKQTVCHSSPSKGNSGHNSPKVEILPIIRTVAAMNESRDALYGATFRHAQCFMTTLLHQHAHICVYVFILIENSAGIIIVQY